MLINGMCKRQKMLALSVGFFQLSYCPPTQERDMIFFASDNKMIIKCPVDAQFVGQKETRDQQR